MRVLTVVRNCKGWSRMEVRCSGVLLGEWMCSVRVRHVSATVGKCRVLDSRLKIVAERLTGSKGRSGISFENLL